MERFGNRGQTTEPDGASHWAGKQAAVLGDSITAAAENWMGQVCDLMGMNLRTRAARSGRRMAQALFAEDDVTPLAPSDFAGVSLTIMLLGTNDTADGTPIGTIGDATEAETFCGRAKQAVEQILTWQPDQRFVICSLLWREAFPSLDPYNAALETMADAYALPFCDLRKRSGFSAFNARWSVPDGLHPSAEGYRRLLVPAVRGYLFGLAPPERSP